jgi:hypothetical protein
VNVIGFSSPSLSLAKSENMVGKVALFCNSKKIV